METVPEQATNFPWAWYSDAEILRREQERIFRRTWQYAGHAGEVAEQGSYFTCTAGHVPVVVARDRNGELNAFVNVCRHRGHPVATGSGRRETLQCPYHAWTYGLDGSLRAAPRSDREPGFERAELGLRRVQVGTWGPFVFVNPDLDTPPLAETLRDLPELVASAGVDVDSLRFRHRSAFELEANWKVVCENFLECYHCPVAHPGFSDMVDVSPDAYRLEISDTYSTQLGPLRSNGKKAYDPSGEVERSQFHFVFPNVGINIFPGRANLSIGPINPLGPSRTARFLDYFFAPDADEGWIEELVAFDDQVGREDRALVEGVQRGVATGLLDQGRLMTSAERLIVHFQDYVRRSLD
jgi:phenylpropionate dioxygenase-like ring-hydroxylating dioxygenase large terminal subunit